MRINAYYVKFQYLILEGTIGAIMEYIDGNLISSNLIYCLPPLS